MAELQKLIQAHLDRYGVTRSEFARRAGTKPQTVQNWWDKPHTLPRPEHLKGVAEVIGVPYLVVLDAALLDAGYRDSLADDPDTLRYRMEKMAEDNAPPPPELNDSEPGPADPIREVFFRDLHPDHGQDGSQQVF